MTESIRKFADRYGMLPRGGLIIAGVSGGADSMCLLHALNAMKQACGFDIAAAHYNHGLRGSESDRDERFVRSYCKKCGIRFLPGRGDVAAYARENGLGLEEAARVLRYAFFDNIAKETGAARIATAHTADDNAETLLMNIARGSGLRGLSGIPPVRGIYVRPLLTLTRRDVLEYLDKNSIPHVEDSSNALDDYTRNRIRHRVMPELAQISPCFSENALRACLSAREDEEYLTQLASDFIDASGSDRSVGAAELSALPSPVKKRVVRLLSGTQISSAHVDAILRLASAQSPSGQTDIPGMTVYREYDRLIFDREVTDVSFDPVAISPGETAEIPVAGVRITCDTVICPRNIHKSLTEFLFKTDSVCGTISVRPRKTGDILRVSGQNSGKTLKKLFIEKHIPRHRRGLVPVLADDAGVLAVFGVGADVRTRAEAGKPAIRVRFEKL